MSQKHTLSLDPSYTETRLVVEQKRHPDGEIECRFTMEVTPDQDEIKLVVHGPTGAPQVIYLTMDTADALNNALVSTIDTLDDYIERDTELFTGDQDEY